MKTQKPTQLSGGRQTLVCDGLAMEYTPGCMAAVDLAATLAMRARLVYPLLPDGSTLATLIAAWIYTGWWPPSRLKRPYTAHPTSCHHYVAYRAQLEGEYSRELRSSAVPTAMRTTFGLLAIGEPGIAVECVICLLRSGFNPEDLLLHSKRERRWRGGLFVRKAAKILKTYIEETK